MEGWRWRHLGRRTTSETGRQDRSDGGRGPVDAAHLEPQEGRGAGGELGEVDGAPEGGTGERPTHLGEFLSDRYSMYLHVVCVFCISDRYLPAVDFCFLLSLDRYLHVHAVDVSFLFLLGGDVSLLELFEAV